MDKIKIILDTDIGGDCDDAGAIALLHRLADEGKAEILGMTHCTSAVSGAYTIKAINEWYGRGEIPIGRTDKKEFLDDGHYQRYTKPIMDMYLKEHSDITFENAIRVIRRILAENEDVTLVTIGMLNNIAELLKSKADDISPLTGVELVRKSVKNMYSMGGNFGDLTYNEYNIACDAESAKFVAENFPKPIIYCGFELGDNVMTGRNLAEGSVVRMAYQLWNEALFKKPMCERKSWDPITVYCAIEQENPYYRLSEPMKITFADEGRVCMSDGGKDYYLIAKASDEEAEAMLNGLMK